MSITPGNFHVGKCYLTTVGGMSRVRRVVCLLADGHIHYEACRNVKPRPVWVAGVQTLRTFAAQSRREVRSDWTLETDSAE